MKKNGKGWGTIGSWVVMLMLVAALAGCGANNEGNSGAAASQASPASTQSQEAAPSEQASEVAGAQTAYPITVKDITGTDVVFDQAPQRIISLAPSETEALFAIGAGSLVVGVDNYSDYPEEAKALPKVGDSNTNIEALLALKPDVVFAHNSMQSKVIEELRKLNVKVFASDPTTLDAVMTKIETFGQILNFQDGAAKVTNTMRAELKQVTDALQGVPAKKVFMEFSPGWTVGSGEYMDEVLKLAGGDNISKEQTGWFKVDPEQVIKANPEVIIYAKSEGAMGDSILEGIQKRPGFEQIDAVKNNQLFPVDDNSISRVGPRLTKVLIEMAKAIHPDKVK